MSESQLRAVVNAMVRGARVILEKKNFPESARAIFDCCREMTGAQSGYVALLSDDGHENEVLFLEAGGLPCTVDPSLPMPIRGLRSLAYDSHRAVYENDFMNSSHVDYLPSGHVAMHNVLFAPLNLDGRTVGIIGLANKPSDFTDDDAVIASVFGDLAAIALENSRYIDLLQEKTDALSRALADIKTLRGIIPICMHCKEIRDDKGYWNQLEKYIAQHSDAQFSHAICDACLEKYYPDLED
ncbi:GAF domain-containing protein [Desulfatiferula olefinivorans]